MAELLRRLTRTRAPAVPVHIGHAELTTALNDADLATRITVRVSATARRVSLRVDPGLGQIVLVQPVRATARYVLDFAASRRAWILNHLDKMPPHVAFTDGLALNLRGLPHTVRFRPDAKKGVWREGAEIFVSGRVEHSARRLKDWLKAHARDEISPVAREMTQRLNNQRKDVRALTHIGVRDTTSRWGSCTHGGRLSFSWRLLLAPDHVFTYVIAHEVAHLKHLNHSPAFWRTVEELLGWTTKEVASARHWLQGHGTALHRFG